MSFVDIGINLMHPSFDKDREEVIKNSLEAGVEICIITGTSVKTSQEAAAYINQPGIRYGEGISPFSKLYFTAGIHPHEAKTFDHESLKPLRDLVRKGAIALGECGLDYNRDYTPRPLQRRCFEKQLELAAELGMPLFLHERDAFEDFSAMLKDFMTKVPGAVVHCFTGREAELEKYLDMGCHIGITGWICDERRGQHLGALVKKIPSQRLMLETDAPFLYPRDLRDPRNLPGKKNGRNEPKYLPHIAAAAAFHQNKDTLQLENETYENSLEFFSLKPKPQI